MAPTVVALSAAKERYSISKDKEPLHSGCSVFDIQLHKIYGELHSFDSFAPRIPLFTKPCDLDMNNNGNAGSGKQKSFTETDKALVSFKNLPLITFPSISSSKFESDDEFRNDNHDIKSKKMPTNFESKDTLDVGCSCQSSKISEDCICYLPEDKYQSIQFADNATMTRHIQYRKQLCEDKFVKNNKSMDQLSQKLRRLQTNSLFAHVSSHVAISRCLKDNGTQFKRFAAKENAWKDLKKVRDMVQFEVDFTDSEDDLESQEFICNTFGRCRRKSDNPPPPMEALHQWKRKRSCIGSQCSWLSLKISSLEKKISDLDQISSQHQQKMVFPKDKYEVNQGPCKNMYEPNELSDNDVCQRTLPFTNYNTHKYIRKQQHLTDCLRCFLSVIPCYQCLQCRKPLAKQTRTTRIGKLDEGFHPMLSCCNEICLSLSVEEVFRKQKIRSKIKLSKPIQKKKPMIKETHYDTLSTDRCPAGNTRLSEKNHPRWKSERTDHQRYDNLHRKRSRIVEATGQGGRLRKSRKPSDYKDSSKPSTPTELGSPFSSSISSSAFMPLKKKKNSSGTDYDINNIVIPYSMAASTRVERIQYKEITTPGWRRVKPSVTVHSCLDGHDNFIELESTEDEAFLERHLQCEMDEKGTYTNYHRPPTRRRPYHLSENTDSGPPSPLLIADSRTTVVTPLDVPLSTFGCSNRLHNLVSIPDEERELTWSLRTYPLNYLETERLNISPTNSLSNSTNSVVTIIDSLPVSKHSVSVTTNFENHFPSNYSCKLSNSLNSKITSVCAKETTLLTTSTTPIETQLLTPAETPIHSPLSSPDKGTCTDIAGNMIIPMT